jgi:cystathionine beta-synthase
MSAVTAAYTISDEERFRIARELLRTNGILDRTASGALVAAALRYCREQSQPKTVVTFICDSGVKYLSKLFNDAWLREENLIPKKSHGDLRDLVAFPVDEGGVSRCPPQKLSAAPTPG